MDYFAMKIFSFVGLPVIFSIAIFLADVKSQAPKFLTVSDDTDITMCASSSGTSTVGVDGKFISALPGWGAHQYKISTKSDSAQFYFNQGLSFYYGYHFTESLASFKESSRFDPSCAMSYWGQALSMGPYYNTYIYRMKKEVPEAITAMLEHTATVSEKEKALIQAMQKRYSNDLTNADRKQLDVQYETALALLKKKYPEDYDITALYIDAVMLQHKWDFWNHDGTPKPWTTSLVAECEAVLKTSKHPAILHYYIHLTEASRQPARALASADLLKDNLPGIAHMVHMSSHMYQRNGLYAKGVDVNNTASAVNNDVDTRAPQLNIGKDRSIHFYAVQSYCAMTAGMYSKGMPLYQRARDRQIALNPGFEREPYAQFVYMMPVMALTRLGKWNEVQQAPQPDATWKYAVVLDNFAKGLANIHAKDLNAAKQNLVALDAAMKDSLLTIRSMPFNSPIQSCRIASSILKGALLYEEGKFTESIDALTSAVEEEDKLVYREPQDWLIPARQFLGAYLLKMNKPLEAEKIYAEDLMLNPGNGWSLLGMYQSKEAQKKSKEATEYKAKYIKAFEASDVQAVGSVF
jgi:tetratricopeptide (TPR) repeat protein